MGIHKFPLGYFRADLDIYFDFPGLSLLFPLFLQLYNSYLILLIFHPRPFLNSFTLVAILRTPSKLPVLPQ